MFYPRRLLVAIATFLWTSPFVYGVVVYTAESTVLSFPTPTMPPNTFDIDFNGDSLADLVIQAAVYDLCVCLPGDPPPPYFVASVMHGDGATNQAYLRLPTEADTFNPAALETGEPIGSGQPYSSQYNQLVDLTSTQIWEWPFTATSGNFQPGAAHLLGVTFQLDNETRYGWVKLETRRGIGPFGGPGELKILGYAYEDSGSHIFAGQTADTLLGDRDDDFDVDGNDFLLWQRDDGSALGQFAWENQYGTGAPLTGVTVVPEPTSGLIAIVAMAIIGALRRVG